MLTTTVENYLKALYLLESSDREHRIPTGQLADALDITPGSASAMIKTLAEAGFLDHEPHHGVRLSTSGMAEAIRIVRRHRIVERFLVDILGMNWSEVHEEAEHLEHAVSDRVIDHMDRLLGHPTVDPHGDPIPDAGGQVPMRQVRHLAGCEVGDRVTIARLADQHPRFLRFAEEHGLRPGAVLDILDRDDIAQSITFRRDDQDMVLALEPAGTIEVAASPGMG
ncbi:MAG: metal-dependent transcriptional regulator [Phycisphaerales bacterium]|nr:metal-dependent transcriptional regulator [Phycisphaerales bacterium]